MTACDLEKSLSSDKPVDITSYVHFLIHVRTYNIIVSTSYTSCRMAVRKVSNSKSDRNPAVTLPIFGGRKLESVNYNMALFA